MGAGHERQQGCLHLVIAPARRRLGHTDDDVPARPERFRMSSECLADPSLPSVALNAGPHGRPADRDADPRLTAGIPSGPRRHPHIQARHPRRPASRVDPAEIGRAGEPLHTAKREGDRQGIRWPRPLRRRRRRTAWPPRVRIRRRKPWRRLRFNTDVGRKVRFMIARGGIIPTEGIGVKAENPCIRSGHSLYWVASDDHHATD